MNETIQYDQVIVPPAAPRRPDVGVGRLARCWWRRTAPIWVVLSIVVLAASGCGGSEEREAKHVARGKQLYEQGDVEKARIEFKNALQINPGNVDALFYVGQLNERAANWRGAIISYSKVVQQDPKHLQAQVKLGQIYLLNGDLQNAEEQAKKASELAPKDPSVLLLEGGLEMRRGNSDAAKQRALEIQAIDPASVEAAVLLASALSRQGDADGAIAALDQAQERNPKDSNIRLMKIRLYGERGNLDKVEEQYQELIALDPKNFTNRLTLARIYAGRDRIDAAETLLREGIAADPGNRDLKLALIDLLAQRRGFSTAEKELQALIAAQPGEVAFAFKLADLYNRNKMPEKAEAILRKIIESEGTSAQGNAARNALARLLVARGDQKEAQELNAAVLDADPANSEALLMSAGFALGRGDHQAALTDIRRVLRNAPDSLPALKLQAEAQFQSGDTELGIDTLQRIVQLDPRNSETRLRLASLLAQRGNRPAALKLLDQAASSESASAQILGARASLLIDQKQWSEAEQAIARIRAMPDGATLADSLTGAMYQARGEFDKAIAVFKPLLAKQPDSAELLTAIVRSYVAQQKTDEAVSFLREVTERSPANGAAQNLMGEILLSQKNTKDAEAAFKQAIAAQPKWPIPYLNLARLYVQQGRLDESMAITRKGTEESPDDMGMLLAYASALETATKYQEAIDIYAKMLEKKPDLDVAINNYGALIADFRYQDRALVQKALQMATSFEDSTNPLYVDTLGWLQYRAGDLPQARANLERAVRLQPNVPQLQYHLGMVLRDLGAREEARKALQSAVVEGATYPGVDEARAALQQL